MPVDEDLLYREMGKRIRTRRKEVGLTQSQLATSIGLLRTSVVNFEAGRQKPPLHVLYAIAIAIDAEPHEFLPSLSELRRSETVAVQIEGRTKNVPTKAAELLGKLIEKTLER